MKSLKPGEAWRNDELMLAPGTFDALAPEGFITTYVLAAIDTGKFEFVHSVMIFRLVIVVRLSAITSA